MLMLTAAFVFGVAVGIIVFPVLMALFLRRLNKSPSQDSWPPAPTHERHWQAIDAWHKEHGGYQGGRRES